VEEAAEEAAVALGAVEVVVLEARQPRLR